MKRKKTDRSNNQTEGTIVEKIRKSQLEAANQFEWRKISRERAGFLKCTLEEENENIVFSYDVHNLSPWTIIRKEKRDIMLSALLDVGNLKKNAEEYCFSLSPENTYYDIQGRAYVKFRDVYNPGTPYSKDIFLRQFKSLIGCTLSKKYKFEDYDNGGQDLLLEDCFLSEIYKCTEVEQIVCLLQEEYTRYREERQERLVEIPKAANKGRKTALLMTSIILIICLFLIGYWLTWESPYEKAVIEANEAYLRSDYGSVVEAMETVDISRMNLYQKYILAVACVKSESFNNESMVNILNTISLNGDEKVMEYWIHINRLETDMAADIAMQLSSDQLLYYAYLKEKALIESDTTMTGQEKAELLSAVENKLEALEQQYIDLIEE